MKKQDNKLFLRHCEEVIRRSNLVGTNLSLTKKNAVDPIVVSTADIIKRSLSKIKKVVK